MTNEEKEQMLAVDPPNLSLRETEYFAFRDQSLNGGEIGYDVCYLHENRSISMETELKKDELCEIYETVRKLSDSKNIAISENELKKCYVAIKKFGNHVMKKEELKLFD